jgi:NitT/TauT family transport system substrate-binding protein
MRIAHPHRARLLAPGALLCLLFLALPLAACGQTGSAGATTPLHHLTLGLTYVPDVQFAPFYVADQLGYYKEAGLDVTLRHHGFNESEFAAISANREDAIFAGGDEILQARAQGVPLVYVAQVFTRYPVALIVPADSPIQTVADLRGHTVGIPGQYGATYIGLLSLLSGAGLSTSDVTIQSIGFTQAAALLGHKVDAVMGYINNEPVQLQSAHFAYRTFPVTQPLISNGLAAPESELSAHGDDIRALVKATLRGVQYAIAHPEDAVNISKKYVASLNDPDKASQALAVLKATLPLWQQGARPGYNDPAAWQSMETFLRAQGQLSADVNVAQVYSNAYLPG